jgi:lipopolysaccharide export system permease protein
VKILGRYLLREHIGPFIFAITALTSMMILQFVGKRLGDLVGKGLPWRVIAEFFVLSIPFTVAMTLPMAVLVAVLYAFSRLASENEVTAMRANGVNMIALMVPVMIGGLGMGVVMLVFNDQVLSRANHELRVLQDDIFRTKPSFALKEQIINEVVPQKFYLRAAHIDRGSGALKDVVIYDLGNQQRRRTIYADRGALALAENQDLLLKLYDGVMLEVPTDRPGQLSRLFYREDQMRVKNVTNSFKESNADSAAKGEREMSVCEMQHALADADLRTRQADYEWMDAKQRMLRLKGDTTRGPARVRPEYRDPPGLGRTYCTLVARLFRVKTAHAAEVGDQGGSPPQRPAQPPAQSPAPPPAQATAPQIAADQMELAGTEQLARTRATMERYQRTRYDIEIQKKFSLAAACLIFVFLGPPIALRFPRGGVGLVIGVSFVVFALYYVGLIGGEELADRLYITPFWAMWGANMILLAVGLLMTSRMNRVSSTSRGGDWSELRDAGKAVLARMKHPFRRRSA